MFVAHGGDVVSTDDLLGEIVADAGELEGVTFLGGEPFEQASALADLARRVRAAGLSVMTFTGRVHEDIVARGDASELALLDATDLLADGPFVIEKPGSKWRWLGSENQRLIPLGSRYAADDPRFFARNTVDIRIDRRAIEISGWAPAAISLGAKAAKRAGGVKPGPSE
jgi:anaerobic ribonucleoside-triphosphate reductase activating protein